ncbi:esterase/lipase family protein [Gordonia lacunae]|uniref:esterase/lipase family protein n=1 Tax=Gordonia lacunae TaxID=417102 RepID=UPI0039E31C3F
MMTNDIVVVVPGVTGSELTYHGEPIWTTSARALVKSILRFTDNAHRLRLPEDIGDNSPNDGIVASRLVDSLHVIPGVWSPICGYDVLLNRLRARGFTDDGPEPNLIAFPYDWRLSNRYNAGVLKVAVERALEIWRSSSPERADSKAVLLCHSMGGLIARWYVSVLGGYEVVSKVITLGTPYRGSPKAVSALALEAPAPFKRHAAVLRQVTSAMPSVHQLLPSYACVETGASLNYLRDQSIPGLSSRVVNDGAEFYASLEEAEARQSGDLPTWYPIIGIEQPTPSGITIGLAGIDLNTTLCGTNFGGDGTVPAASVPRGMSLDDNRLNRIGDKHGHLQANAAVLDEVLGIITATSFRFKAPGDQIIAVDSPEVVSAGERWMVSVSTDRLPTALIATVLDENRRVLRRTQHNIRTSPHSLELGPLEPGGYTIALSPAGQPPERSAVVSPVLVWSPTE